MKCKNYCNLIPYLRQKSYSVDKIISNLNYITEDMDIELLQIQGGEPFTHKEIDKIVEKCVINTHIHKIEIASNGTVMPSEKVVKIIKMYPDKIQLRFSRYKCTEKIRDNIEKKLSELYGLDVKEYDFIYENGEWFDLGSPYEEKQLNAKLVRQIYDKCPNKSCWTLSEDYFAGCGRMISYLQLKEGENLKGNNIIDVSKLRQENRRFIDEFQLFEDNYNNFASELCGYYTIGENMIPAAVQMEQDEIKL